MSCPLCHETATRRGRRACDFAMRELNATQADDVYEPVTERAALMGLDEPALQPATVDRRPLLPNPVVAEPLLDRLISTSHDLHERTGLPPEQAPPAGGGAVPTENQTDAGCSQSNTNQRPYPEGSATTGLENNATVDIDPGAALLC